MPAGTTDTFGLIHERKLKGVCLFGTGANNHNISLGRFKMLELTRLVVEEGLPKNSASFLVSNSLKLLPKPRVIVSYADINHGHVGYIYQATNWLYTGIGAKIKNTFLNGKLVHRKTLWEIFGTSNPDKINTLHKDYHFEFKESKGKHRYFYLLGSKKDKKEMRTLLEEKWGIYPYPKGDTTRHEPRGSIQPKNKNFFQQKMEKTIGDKKKEKRIPCSTKRTRKQNHS